jgi:hypothetical protein
MEDLLGPITSDEDFAACEKTDRIFEWVLGRTLEQAVTRIVILGTVGCAVLVLISTLVI